MRDTYSSRSYSYRGSGGRGRDYDRGYSSYRGAYVRSNECDRRRLSNTEFDRRWVATHCYGTRSSYIGSYGRGWGDRDYGRRYSTYRGSAGGRDYGYSSYSTTRRYSDRDNGRGYSSSRSETRRYSDRDNDRRYSRSTDQGMGNRDRDRGQAMESRRERGRDYGNGMSGDRDQGSRSARNRGGQGQMQGGGPTNSRQ